MREATARLAIDELLDALDEDRPKVARLLERIRAQLDKDPALYDLYGDVVTAVENTGPNAVTLMPPRPSDSSGSGRPARSGWSRDRRDRQRLLQRCDCPHRYRAPRGAGSKGPRGGSSTSTMPSRIRSNAGRWRRVLRYLASQPASLSGPMISKRAWSTECASPRPQASGRPGVVRRGHRRSDS